MADQPQQPEVATTTELPAGISMQDILAALAAQSSPTRTAPSPDQLAALASAPFTAELVSSTGQNARALHCLLCHTVVLNPLTAAHHTATQHTLPPFPATAAAAAVSGEHSWLVDDQMTFENVGVTRGVEGGVRYLVCGNCDGGPIGCVYAEAPQAFYVLHGRIQYKQSS